MSSLTIEEYRDRFAEVLRSAQRLLDQKAGDYEDAEMPCRTFRLSKELGIAPWRGCLLRMSDKVSLVFSFVSRGGYMTHDEDFTETLRDVIIYAGLTVVLYENDKGLPPLAMEQLLDRMRDACSRPPRKDSKV